MIADRVSFPLPPLDCIGYVRVNEGRRDLRSPDGVDRSFLVLLSVGGLIMVLGRRCETLAIRVGQLKDVVVQLYKLQQYTQTVGSCGKGQMSAEEG